MTDRTGITLPNCTDHRSTPRMALHPSLCNHPLQSRKTPAVSTEPRVRCRPRKSHSFHLPTQRSDPADVVLPYASHSSPIRNTSFEQLVPNFDRYPPNSIVRDELCLLRSKYGQVPDCLPRTPVVLSSPEVARVSHLSNPFNARHEESAPPLVHQENPNCLPYHGSMLSSPSSLEQPQDSGQAFIDSNPVFTLEQDPTAPLQSINRSSSTQVIPRHTRPQRSLLTRLSRPAFVFDVDSNCLVSSPCPRRQSAIDDTVLRVPEPILIDLTRDDEVADQSSRRNQGRMNAAYGDIAEVSVDSQSLLPQRYAQSPTTSASVQGTVQDQDEISVNINANLFAESDIDDESFVPSDAESEPDIQLDSNGPSSRTFSVDDWFLRYPSNHPQLQFQRDDARHRRNLDAQESGTKQIVSVRQMSARLRQLAENPVAMARFALSGEFIRERRTAIIDYEVGIRAYGVNDIHVRADVDSFLWVGTDLHLPVVRNEIIEILPNPDHRIWSKMPFNDIMLPFSQFQDRFDMQPITELERKSGEFQMNTCQKLMIAQMGASNMFKVMIYFPRLRKLHSRLWQDYPNEGSLNVFYEKFFFPAVHYVAEKERLSMRRSFPRMLSRGVLNRSAGGGPILQEKYDIPSHHFKSVLLKMQQLIQDEEEDGAQFQGAFVHIYSKNSKDHTREDVCSMNNHETFLPWLRFKHLANVLDWEGAIEDEGCLSFCDLGLEFGTAESRRGDEKFVYFFRQGKVKDLFRATGITNRRMDKEHYSNQIGGGRGAISTILRKEQRSPIIKLAAYHTLKQVYTVHSSRVGPTTLSLSEVHNDSERFNLQIEVLQEALEDAQLMDHPCRIEYRINSRHVPSGRSITSLVTNFIDFQPFIRLKSVEYVRYLHLKSQALIHATDAARRCSRNNLVSQNDLHYFLAACIHIFRSMFHRPDDRSWDRKVCR